MDKYIRRVGMTAIAVGSGLVSATAAEAKDDASGQKQPNIILIMVDDMGYSDIGCYGGEIPTPNIDRLASDGVRFTQFYNTGRSCPSRAALLTGLYAHQAGIGKMSEDPGSKKDSTVAPEGYKGYLNRNCVTIAEVLKEAGYSTYMCGKWHVGMHDRSRWPLQRGFDHFYGILAGATSYLRPSGGRGLWEDNAKLPEPEDGYYTTDAFTDYALSYISSSGDDKPFFLYLAYNAPHWPLHAKEEDIERFRHFYDDGWQVFRSARLERMKQLGIVDESCKLAEWESRTWDQLTPEEQANSSLRMAVYAAQVSRIDQNIGRVLEYLDESGQRDNTVIVFLSDNGGCAEPYSETGFGTIKDINNKESWVAPSYGLPWAQVSNTPFRKYKVRAYEGGISTPLIISWPDEYSKYNGQMRSSPGYITDIMATFIEVSGAEYPKTAHGGKEIHPLEGKSILPAITNPKATIHDYIFGEHFDNRFVRHGNWKAVWDEKGKSWELYNIKDDRAETENLATNHPKKLQKMVKKWEEWAATHMVIVEE